MTKAKAFIALALLVAIAAFAYFRYANDLNRLRRVEVGSASFAPGTLNKIVLKNTSSSRIDFTLRCHYKLPATGKPLLSEAVVLPPFASVEFDPNPEFAGGETPRMVRGKSCEAIWRGPFGMERTAWWVSWAGPRVRKMLYVEP